MTPERPTRSPLDRTIVRLGIGGVLLAALIAALVLFRAGGRGDSAGPVDIGAAPTAAGEASPEAGTGALSGRPPVTGQPAPDVALRDASGRLVKLSDLRGKVVWVNFWATWCVPCKQELPDIQKLYDEKRDAGLEVLEVNWQDKPDDAQSFFDGLGLTLPLVFDRSGAVFEQYRLRGLPDSFFIDRDGNISSVYFGQLSEKKMRDRLERAGLP